MGQRVITDLNHLHLKKERIMIKKREILRGEKKRKKRGGRKEKRRIGKDID